MDISKASRAEAERREKLEERRMEQKESDEKKNADARRNRKVAKHCVVPLLCSSGELESRADLHCQMKDEKWWKNARRCGAKHISKSKCNKIPQRRTIFGSWDVAEVYAVVARSAFGSQNVQGTSVSGQLWKWRRRKSARHCGTKHISRWKNWKQDMFAPFLDVQMRFRVTGAKDCAPSQKGATRTGLATFSKTTPGHIKNEAILRDFLHFWT